MRHWQVKVVGERKPKPKRAWWTVLVQAETGDEAMVQAVEYVMTIADSRSLWAGFAAQEAATVELPITLSN